VEVIEDDALQTTAVVQMASRRTLPVHLIRYKATAGQLPDYLICHQCAFILRLFACPPEERLQVAYAPAGYEAVSHLLQAHLGSQGYDQNVIRQAAERFLTATVTHLRSVPIGLRVSTWLAQDYPELAPLQRAQVMNELALNSESFSPQAQAIQPPAIHQAVMAINAAYALFWAQRYKKPSLMQAYVQAGYRPQAGALLDIYHQTLADPAHDRALIDAWAAALGLSGWYQWVHYEPPVRHTP
jgi:hypothetical protein